MCYEEKNWGSTNMPILSKDHEFKSCEHEKTSNDRNKVNYIQKKKPEFWSSTWYTKLKGLSTTWEEKFE